MLRIVARFAVFIAIGVAAFYAMRFYSTIRFAQHLGDCSTPAELDIVGNKAANEALRLETSSRIYRCISEKQSFIDRTFLKVPVAWTKPPL